MKKSDIHWVRIEVANFSANPIPSGYPYKQMMRKGKVFPITRAQAKAFLDMNCALGNLNNEDVRVVESLMNKHGMTGDYRYSNRGMVKLVNSCDLDRALMLEYNFE